MFSRKDMWYWEQEVESEYFDFVEDRTEEFNIAQVPNYNGPIATIYINLAPIMIENKREVE